VNFGPQTENRLGVWTHPTSTGGYYALESPSTGWAKSDTLLVFEFPLLLHALCLQFLFTHVSFSLNDVVLRLPMRINCNFVTTVGLTNDERCLIHNLRVKKHWRSGFERIMKICSNKWTHLSCVQLIPNANQHCTSSINGWCFAVYVSLHWQSWKRCHFFGPYFTFNAADPFAE